MLVTMRLHRGAEGEVPGGRFSAEVVPGIPGIWSGDRPGRTRSPSISFRDAAGPPQSQAFVPVGALLIIPFILTYTAWAYHVFRGKVTESEGYHRVDPAALVAVCIWSASGWLWAWWRWRCVAHGLLAGLTG
jgi:hypothetical protein